jgi:non-ribosomal peptide synthetase component E (peptide arylation enzyme)
MSREQWLVRAAARRPDRVAVEASGERLTYAELLERAREAARALVETAGPLADEVDATFAGSDVPA